MSDLVQVDGYKDLVRDMKSTGIINRNKNAFENARARAAEARNRIDEIRDATREINTLKCEMHEIKDMLTILLDRK